MTQYYVPIEEQLLILNALIIEATRSLEKKARRISTSPSKRRF